MEQGYAGGYVPVLSDIPLNMSFIMSDGNYNRNLLPYNNYRSGVRAGRAQMKQLALDSLARLLEHELPSLSEDGRKHILTEYKRMLEQ